MSTVIVSLYIVNGGLEESSSSDTNPTPKPDATTQIAFDDSIQWVLGTNSGISSIDSITPKNDPQLFSTPPGALNNWTCKIGAPISKIPYDYTICYTPVGGVQICTDPKIRVNPGTSGN